MTACTNAWKKKNTRKSKNVFAEENCALRTNNRQPSSKTITLKANKAVFCSIFKGEKNSSDFMCAKNGKTRDYRFEQILKSH